MTCPSIHLYTKHAFFSTRYQSTLMTRSPLGTGLKILSRYKLGSCIHNHSPKILHYCILASDWLTVSPFVACYSTPANVTTYRKSTTLTPMLQAREPHLLNIPCISSRNEEKVHNYIYKIQQKCWWYNWLMFYYLGGLTLTTFTSTQSRGHMLQNKVLVQIIGITLCTDNWNKQRFIPTSKEIHNFKHKFYLVFS